MLYCKGEALFLKQFKAGGDGIRVVQNPPVSGNFLQRILTKEEIAYLRSRGASAADTLAGLYAAKEAIVKALGCGIAFPLTEIAISHTAQGQPTAALSGEAALRYPGHLLLTITHDAGVAAASALYLE